MTKDEALKMAIDFAQRGGSISVPQYYIERDKLINACKEALEQPEIGDSEIKQMLNDIEYYQKRVEELEQPEGKEFFERGKEIAQWADKQAQEPVAWTKESELTRITTLRFPMAMWKNKYTSIENNIPLYTHPHQWQGLTDDEIDYIREGKNWTLQIYPNHFEFNYLEFAHAIEQALKEKNNG